MPSALLNVISMVGPRSASARSPSHAPNASATMGTSQMSHDGHAGPRRTTAFGTSEGSAEAWSTGSAMALALRIEKAARIEADGCEHGEDHDGTERERTGPDR